MIRYGGLYARHHKIDSRLHRPFRKAGITFIAASINGVLLFCPLSVMILWKEDELLDMDYFLNEDDLFADEAGVEGFYIF